MTLRLLSSKLLCNIHSFIKCYILAENNFQQIKVTENTTSSLNNAFPTNKHHCEIYLFGQLVYLILHCLSTILFHRPCEALGGGLGEPTTFPQSLLLLFGTEKKMRIKLPSDSTIGELLSI